MLKRLLLVLLLLLAQVSHASIFEPFGGDRPFPRTDPVAFPWDKIQGTWMPDTQDDIYFNFKIIRQTASGTKYLQIEVADADTTNILATGVAVTRKREKLVRGKVKDAQGWEYNILIGTYNETENGQVLTSTYLAVRALDSTQQADVNYRLKKISKESGLQKK